ncbi:MAG: hypothetical protein WC509_03095 [Candidatus Izemoplasmatales bacterium]
MKKAIIVAFLAFLLVTLVPLVTADDYQTYQEIVFVEEDEALLKDFAESDMADYLSRLGGKKMLGWKMLVVTKQQEVEFLSETKLKIFNNGYSTIKHEITLTSKIETKFQISSTGSIGVTVSGSVEKFKGSLDSSIKTEIGYSKTETATEQYEFSIIVDPGTYVTIVMKGLGVVSNGVARHYFLWMKTNEGGWETFTVTTEYYEIVKERIR